MFYSVKMRSALGGAHEKGGKHISGAERIVTQDGLELTVSKMLQRAKTHQRGSADFINIKVELIETDKIIYQPLLAINSYETNDYNDGRKIALEQLIIDGVSPIAAQKGIECIKSLNDSMRGAILLDAITGERLDNNISRGIRVSNMDAENNALYILELSKSGYVGEHVQEALILASKVASAKEIIAELCWSDDPNYVTGYVASSENGYRRISVLKEIGDPIGGRVFFIKNDINIDDLINYLEDQPVMIRSDNFVRS